MKDEFTPYTPNPEKIIELFEKLEKGETLGKRSKNITRSYIITER